MTSSLIQVIRPQALQTSTQTCVSLNIHTHTHARTHIHCSRTMFKTVINFIIQYHLSLSLSYPSFSLASLHHDLMEWAALQQLWTLSHTQTSICTYSHTHTHTHTQTPRTSYVLLHTYAISRTHKNRNTQMHSAYMRVYVCVRVCKHTVEQRRRDRKSVV